MIFKNVFFLLSFLSVFFVKAQKIAAANCTDSVDALNKKKEIYLASQQKEMEKAKLEKSSNWLREVITQHLADFDGVLGENNYNISSKINPCFIGITAKPIDKNKRIRTAAIQTSSPWTCTNVDENGYFYLDAYEKLIDSNTLQPKKELLHTRLLFKNGNKNLCLQLIENLKILSSTCVKK